MHGEVEMAIFRDLEDECGSLARIQPPSHSNSESTITTVTPTTEII